MSDRLSKAPTKVTVEDLLRLKRAERPPPEFWTEFERELRQRQLAALVERKPWWNGLSASAGRFGWLRLPVGAAAALALTLLSVRQYSYSGGQPSVMLGAKPFSGAATSPESVAPKPVESGPAASSVRSAVAEETPNPKGVESAASVAGISQVTSREIAGLVARVGEFDNGGSPSERESLSGPFAIQLAMTDPAGPTAVEETTRSIGFEDRSMSTSHPHRIAEVLPTAMAVTEQRRARLLAALGSVGAYAPEPSAPEHAKRSVIRYLAEDGWDRSMSRLQADADHLSIRF